MKKILVIALKTLLPLLFGVFLFVYFFQKMAPEVKEAFFKALKEANYFWILLSVLAGVLAIFSRAERWKYMLEPIGFPTRFWNRVHAVTIGYLVNLTIPRAGEASRAGVLLRTEKTPFASAFGTIIAERVLDVIMLFLILLISISISAEDFWKIKQEIQNSFGKSNSTGFSWVKWIFIGLFIGGTIVFFVLKKVREKIISIARNLLSGALGIFKTKHPFRFLGHTLFIWCCYLIVFYLPVLSLDELANLPLKAVLIGFIAGSIGISLTNGGIGVFPLLVGLVVNYFLKDELGDKAEGLGYALGMLIWGSQTIVVIIGGLVSLSIVSLNSKK